MIGGKFIKIKKHHRHWLDAINATNQGNSISFDYVGITPKRLEILDDMGLIKFSGGRYTLTEKGQIELLRLRGKCTYPSKCKCGPFKGCTKPITQ